MAGRYSRLFAAAALPSEFRTPDSGGEHVFHQYTVRAPRRAALREFLKERAIATEVYYPLPLHLQECLRDLGYRKGSMPRAEAAASCALSLPIHPTAASDVPERVVAAVEAFYRS